MAGDLEDAIELYRRSIVLGAPRVWALSNIAYAYHSIGADRECAATIAEIRASDPQEADALEAELKR
jgi:hypothetical protein